MPPRVTQEEWDRRAAAVGLAWEAPVARATTKAPARCLTCGHRWKTLPGNVSQGAGCPMCGRRRVEAALRLPQQAWAARAAAVGIAWEEDVRAALVKTRARCLTCRYRWAARPSEVQQGTGCPKCARSRQRRPTQKSQEEWDERGAAVGLVWLENVPTTSTKTRARCLTCEHVWEAHPNAVRRGSGCPVCGIVRRGITRRKPQRDWDADAAAAGLVWEGPVATSTTKTPARCLTCGYRWNALPGEVHQGSGCPACAGKRLDQSDWDARASAVGLAWDAPVHNALVPTPAHCLTCGHRWSAYPASVQQGRRCPVCGIARRADLHRTPQPEWDERAAAVGLVWEGDVVNALAKTPVRCLACDYRWDVVPASVQQGYGCPRCGGNLPIPQAAWDERAAAVGIVWEAPVLSSPTKTPARCLTCGYRWDARPGEVQQGHGCPACTDRGFDYAGPSRLYLALLPDPPIMKVGVSGEGRARLDVHRRRGWGVVNVWALPTGRDAVDLEDAVVGWWQDQSPVFCERYDVPAGDGFTESVHVGRVDVPGTLKFIEALVSDDGRDQALP